MKSLEIPFWNKVMDRRNPLHLRGRRSGSVGFIAQCLKRMNNQKL
jgi:hypothetical protein